VSDLINDKDTVQNGRRGALKDVSAPLRDQIVDKLYNKLVDLGVGIKVSNMWLAGSANRDSWLERQRAYLASWDEHLVNSTDGPSEGSSNLHIPMPFIVCKTMHARFMQAIWQDPPFSVKARNEASIERAPTVADTLRYYIMDGANYYKGIEAVVDKWVWDWITVGSAIKKWMWDVTYTRFIDVQTVQEVIGSQFARGPDGNEVEVPIIGPVEKEVPVTKKTFEGPCAKLVDAEDILIIGGDGDPDEADAVLHRDWLTASELWTLSDRGIFKADAVEKILEAGPDRVEGASATDIKQQRAQNAGRAQLDTDQDLDRYEIIEAYLEMPVDESGINSDIIVWVHARSGEICRATYLYRVSPTGERPFAKIDFQLRKGQEFGTGMVELLYPLSKEMDAIHNIRLDFGLVSVMPFGFYRPTGGIDPEKIELEPGVLIPVDNPQTDVYFPNLGNRTVFGFQEEQALQTLIERMTSISDLNLGLMSGGQGATRTATGARALVGEMSANLDVYLRRLNRGWKKSLRYLLHMLQKRIPPGLSYRLTGDDGKDYWRQIRTADDIAGNFDLEVSPNSASSNQGIQQEKANQILQLTSNPLDIQLGIITPAQRYEALKTWYQAHEVKDFARYIQKPQGYARVFTPAEELNRVLLGVKVPITPEMDHEGYIALWQEFKDNDELLGQFNELQTIEAEKQAMAHAQMLQALEQMAAQQANARQMNMNAAMSQQQTPAGMNPMAGSAAPPAQ
jgi:hypothetical protein